MADSPDVIIVGGGVIGCSIAFHLARLGARPLVLERGRLGAEASNAASGAVGGRPGPHPYDRLETQSFDLFQSAASELQELSGVDPEIVKSGRLNVAFTDEEAQEFQLETERLNELGGSAEWLDRKATLDLEPALSDAIVGAAYSRDVCRVNNQRMSEAYAKAAMRFGAQVHQGVMVAGLTSAGQRVTGVQTHGGPLYAGHVVLAAGAWTEAIADRINVKVPVRPVRGQNLNLQPTDIGLRIPVNGGEGVLVPRNDGSVVTGVTVEEVGFDDRVTAEGIRSILAQAFQIVPSLKNAALNWAVSGLRPASPDGMPILGPVSGWEGLYIATGHHRSGVSLSAVTGKLIAEHVTSGEADLPPEFSPDRFAK